MTNDANPLDSLPVEVGRRLRERRQERHQTLQDVAVEADISLSHLGEIETGKTSCSLPVLLRLSRALDYPVAHILPALGASRIRAEAIQSGTPQRTISHDGLGLIVRAINLAAGATTEVGVDGYDTMLYVVDGDADVQVGTTSGWTSLGRGDSAEIRQAPTVTVRASRDLMAVVVIGPN